MRKNIFIDWVISTIRLILGKKRSIIAWNWLIESIQSHISLYITYRLRPKSTSIVHFSSNHITLPKLAVVIQGPVITKDDFTLETVKLYKQLYPNAMLILSTWDDCSPDDINLFYQLDIHILLNAKPVYAGESNINLQIATSKAGIKKAQELGAEYVMKTRTDQRMYAPNIAQFFFDLLNQFPLKECIKKQRKRIIGVSLNTFKYRMYGLSDMLIYGHIDDMLLFWNIPLDNRIFTEKEREEATASLRNFANLRICEVYLVTEFLIRIDQKLEWTLENSWGKYADHFCIVDKELLDLYWNKYGSMEDRWIDYNKATNIFEELNFREWFNLYCNSNQIKPLEEILDLSIKSN